MKMFFKNQKGITLIALVVTIIVLIILAGISLNLLLGDNGILIKAKESKQVYDESKLKEQMTLILADYIIERQTTGITLEDYLTKNNIEYEEDGDVLKVEKDGFIVSINKLTLEMESPVKATKYAKIQLNKNTVEPGNTLIVTLAFGEDVDIANCKYKFEKADVTVEKADVTNSVGNTTINITAPNEKGEYYFYLLVAYKDSEEILLKKTKVKVDVPVSEVTLNKANVNLYVGEEESLQVTVLPAEAEQGITWSTSNPSIATVDSNGKVTAVSGGTAQITATSNENINKTATCTVTVETLTSIEITTQPTKLEYDKGDTLDLTGIVVTANYASGSSAAREVTSQITASPATTLDTVGTININISYTEGNIIKSVVLPVNVLPVSTAVVPITLSGMQYRSDSPRANAIDGNANTVWYPDVTYYPTNGITGYYNFTFNDAYAFSSFSLISNNPESVSRPGYYYALYGGNTSADGDSDWTMLYECTDTGTIGSGVRFGGENLVLNNPQGTSYRYLRLELHPTAVGDYVPGIREISFYVYEE